jgi:adenylosuccinate synthase
VRNGLRVGDLKDMPYFEERLVALVTQLQRAYPDLKVDVQEELKYYKEIRGELLPMIVDSVDYCNDALESNQSILVEGANATSKLKSITLVCCVDH